MSTCQAEAIRTFKSILGIQLFIYSFFASRNLKLSEPQTTATEMTSKKMSLAILKTTDRLQSPTLKHLLLVNSPGTTVFQVKAVFKEMEIGK